MSTVDPIRVMLVDDQPIVRSRLCDLLQDFRRFVVVRKAGNGEQALRLIQKLKALLVTMDVITAHKDVIEACCEVTVLFPDTRIVILTTPARQDAVVHVVAAVANGSRLKFAPRNALLTAVLEVAEDRLSVPDEAINRVFVMVRWPHPCGDTRSAVRLTQIKRETLTLYRSVSSHTSMPRHCANKRRHGRTTCNRILTHSTSRTYRNSRSRPFAPAW